MRLLISGGSLGAAIFASRLPDAIALLPEALRARLQITQQVRADQLDALQERYANMGIEAELSSFFGDMPARFKTADLIISRSGASSVTEIAAAGRPALFIPFAGAMDDHQMANAKQLAKKGAAAVLREADASADALAEMLRDLLSQPELRVKMAKAARKAARPDAAETMRALSLSLCQMARPSGATSKELS